MLKEVKRIFVSNVVDLLYSMVFHLSLHKEGKLAYLLYRTMIQISSAKHIRKAEKIFIECFAHFYVKLHNQMRWQIVGEPEYFGIYLKPTNISTDNCLLNFHSFYPIYMFITLIFILLDNELENCRINVHTFKVSPPVSIKVRKSQQQPLNVLFGLTFRTCMNSIMLLLLYSNWA